MSAAEAVRSMPEFNPDIVLTDIGMPGQDGYTVLREGRAFRDQLGRAMPMVAVTAYARADDRERAIAAGFDDYLAKPVDPNALIVAVATLAGLSFRPRLAKTPID
jgi:CheY-like chemotaxis protein